jgi:hypothetical protein
LPLEGTVIVAISKKEAWKKEIKDQETGNAAILRYPTARISRQDKTKITETSSPNIGRIIKMYLVCDSATIEVAQLE